MSSTYISEPRSYSFAPANINTAGFAAGVSGATWTLTATSAGDNLAHKVTIKNNSSNSKAGIAITITGTDANGAAQTETIAAGPAGTSTVTSTKYFLTVTSIAPASTWGADTADLGWAGSFATPFINVNYIAEDILSLALAVTGTINVTLNQTFDRYDIPGSAAPRWSAIASSQTANGVFQTTGGATGVQLIANSYSNGATITLNANATFVANAPGGAASTGTPTDIVAVGGTAISLGQAAMAASIPVVLPSNQSAIPVNPAAAATGGASYQHIAAGQATTTVKSGAGTLYAIIFNSKGVATDVTTIYDSTTGSGTVIGIPDAVNIAVGQAIDYGPVGIAFATGLTIVTATANGGDMTVVYK